MRNMVRGIWYEECGMDEACEKRDSRVSDSSCDVKDTLGCVTGFHSHLDFGVHEPRYRLLDGIQGVLLHHHDCLHVLQLVLLAWLAGSASRPQAPALTAPPEVSKAYLGGEGWQGLSGRGLGHALL